MINLQQARELLARAVETQGRDFVYNANGKGLCHYTPDGPADTPKGKTGCLAGVALNLAGETRHHGYDGSVYDLNNDFPDIMTTEAMHYLVSAQVAQDLGSSWGQAHYEAEYKLAERGWVDA